MLHRTFRLYRNAFSGLSKDVWLLSTVSFINRAGTMVVPFLSVYMTQQLHFTLKQTGIVMSFFGAGSVAGSFFGGRLTDKLGFYPVQFWTLFLSGAVFLFLRRIETFGTMCVLVFVLSTIADAFRPANFAAVAVYSRPENRTRSFSLLRLAVNIGWSVGPALGGFLAAAKGYGWLFWIDGLTCISAACFLRIFLRPKKEPDSDGQEPGAVPVAVSAYRDRVYLVFIALLTLISLAFMQFFSTLPVFFKSDLQINEGQIGTLLAMNGLMVAILEMPMVYRLEGRVPKLILISMGAIAIGASFLLYPLLGSWIGVAYSAVFLLTIGEILNMPFANAFSLGRSTPKTRGQYMGLYTMTYSVALILAPTVGMQIAGSLGFYTLWYILAILCGFAAAGLFVLNRKIGGS